MTNRVIFGLIVFILSGSVYAGGVTIRNYSGEHVMVMIGLCTAYHFPGWDSKTKAFKPVSRVGAQAFNPESCGPMLNNYFFDDTESKQYELVLTRENARREYHRAWNPYYWY